MTWGDESDDSNSKFKEVALPPGFLDDADENEVLGITLSPPEVEPAESAPRSKRHLDNPAAGRETWNRQLRPRHRNVVRNYFDSK